MKSQTKSHTEYGTHYNYPISVLFSLHSVQETGENGGAEIETSAGKGRRYCWLAVLKTKTETKVERPKNVRRIGGKTRK